MRGDPAGGISHPGGLSLLSVSRGAVVTVRVAVNQVKLATPLLASVSLVEMSLYSLAHPIASASYCDMSVPG